MVSRHPVPPAAAAAASAAAAAAPASASASSADPDVASPEGNDSDDGSEVDEDDRRQQASGAAARKKLVGSADEAEGGKGMGATKAFSGALVAPSSAPAVNRAAPTRGLELAWAYGYRAFDSKSNLVSNSRGELIYPVAGLIVVLDEAQHKQRYFLGHTDDVRCLANSPADRDWIASGQNATIDDRGRSLAPHVCVWNSADPELHQSFKLPLPVGARAVRSVAFSPDGRFVAAAANDDDHTLYVFDWRERKLIASAKGDKNPILQVKFNHVSSQGQGTYELFSVGIKHAFVWSFSPDAGGAGSLSSKRISLGAGAFPMQTWNAVAFTEKGSACLGGSDGTILLVKPGAGAVSKSYAVSPATGTPKAAKVFSLDRYSGGIVAGLSDKTVVVLDSKLAISKTFGPFDFRVVSVHVRNEVDLIVGTMGGQVLELRGALTPEVASGTVKDRFPAAYTAGHCDGELWAAVASPDDSRGWTAGEDNQLLAWDLLGHKLIARGKINDKKALAPKIKKASTTSLSPPNQCARALALSPDGLHLALGSNDGALTVYNAATLAPIAHVDLNNTGQRQVKDQTGNWIQSLEYSPSGKLLAVGTHGSAIVLLDSNSYKIKEKIHAHHSFITHMDWSVDGSVLRSNDGAYELLFHAVDPSGDVTVKQISSASQVKDTVWATNHCTITYATAGAVPNHDGSSVNSMDTSSSASSASPNENVLLAVAQDDGRVALYNYPVPEDSRPQYHEYRGHSSHVTSVRFIKQGQELLSTGGHDLALFQWKVTNYQADKLGRTHTLEGQ